MRTITVNGKLYPAKEFDLNTVCDLEDMGVSLENMQNKPLSGLRAYVALCIGRGVAYAGNEIQNHVLNGGTFQDIMDVMGKQMEESDFFRKFNNQTTAEMEAAETTEDNPEK